MEMESERESAAVASMAAEPMRRPRVRLKKNIHSFTRMERKRMTTAIQEKVVTSGEKIFSREDLPISTPIRRMARATTRPVRYSIRPWPKGCSWSASWSGQPEPHQGDDGGGSIRQVVEGIGHHGNGAGGQAGEELAQKEQGIERECPRPQGHRAAPLTDLGVSGIRTGGEQKTNEKRGHGDSSCHFGILLLSHIWKEQSRKRRWGPFLLPGTDGFQLHRFYYTLNRAENYDKIDRK